MFNKSLCFPLSKYPVVLFGNSTSTNVGLGTMKPRSELMELLSHDA